MKRVLALAALAVIGLLIVVSCGSAGAQSGNQINVQLTEMKYEPNTWTVKAGQPVTVTAKNTGSVVHDWSIRGTNPEVSVVVQAGQTSTATFTIQQPGTYQVYCNQPGHEEAGMKGTLTVQ